MVIISLIMNIKKKCKPQQVPAVISQFSFALRSSPSLCKVFLDIMKGVVLPPNSISLLILLSLANVEVSSGRFSHVETRPVCELPTAELAAGGIRDGDPSVEVSLVSRRQRRQEESRQQRADWAG